MGREEGTENGKKAKATTSTTAREVRLSSSKGDNLSYRHRMELALTASKGQ